MYDKNGKLTRQAAEQIIRGGGSVSIGPRIYGTVESLPSEAEFAKGDANAEAGARERLEAQRKAIDAQLASLTPTAATTDAKTEDADAGPAVHPRAHASRTGRGAGAAE